LWYLPVIMALMMVHKQGMDWVKWAGLNGEDDAQDS
jgi:protoheme IX farnesyltransferase